VIARERRVIAADFGARSLGVRQEIQVVNCNHLGRRPRRQQQRVRGMGHVKWPSREHFGGRPSQTVPRQIQQTNRNASIDDRRAGQLCGTCEPILP
jgi:hypothetical protein